MFSWSTFWKGVGWCWPHLGLLFESELNNPCAQTELAPKNATNYGGNETLPVLVLRVSPAASQEDRQPKGTFPLA